MQDISTIILTFNEEKHIERCITNAQRFCSQVYLVDSYSTDNTVELAKRLGAKVYQNKWENNYAKQLNWGLENIPIATEWVFRLDADEYLTDDLIEEINEKLPVIGKGVSGVVFERKMYFLDTLMTKGMLQMNMLRLFRYRHGFCEERWMDEHIVLTQGKSIQFDGFFVDHNLNSLGWWVQKHNGYSIREAIDLLNLEYNFIIPKSAAAQQYEMSADALSKRGKKKKYANMPLFWRSFFYFVYRYIFKFGFTQGKEGFLWHFLQGWWYRTLVDAKVYEVKKACGNDTEKMKRYIFQNYQIKV
ncbi:glycosyltransferase family 2 protein [Maribacter polysaccharolyticus]|uniref:glycosyltransferase family 2 protein n=1 Tax=Maribacter polysaccharolyticus TaxID=3020831 RepID=UPI00237F659B|nr:glycosyltransferase family 2 protein [Maribacter polysaccharolyticus]MDE3741489.1 glycosyltransferase family 2 protein [Maribacter polysaccharolyticus]